MDDLALTKAPCFLHLILHSIRGAWIELSGSDERPQHIFNFKSLNLTSRHRSCEVELDDIGKWNTMGLIHVNKFTIKYNSI